MSDAVQQYQRPDVPVCRAVRHRPVRASSPFSSSRDRRQKAEPGAAAALERIPDHVWLYDGWNADELRHD